MPDYKATHKPDGSHLQVADRYWDSLQKKDRALLANITFFDKIDDERLRFKFLNEIREVDFSNRCLLERSGHGWTVSDDPLLTLATVVYLNNVRMIYPVGRDIVGVKDLKEGHFFTGPHALRIDRLLTRFGHDPEGFKRAAEALSGHHLGMADVAYRLMPFPRVPVYYLLWQGDEEFAPRLNVLFDRSIENVFPADAIWGLVNRVTMAFGIGD
ncbi:MAG: hypothetical protein DSY90_04320 [Deltaproteobacteria bacterium]|nr:MAG: hypothetical protein DSY90_04320 [Deltaproteobacteria bacterium]